MDAVLFIGLLRETVDMSWHLAPIVDRRSKGCGHAMTLIPILRATELELRPDSPLALGPKRRSQLAGCPTNETWLVGTEVIYASRAEPWRKGTRLEPFLRPPAEASPNLSLAAAGGLVGVPVELDAWQTGRKPGSGEGGGARRPWTS